MQIVYHNFTDAFEVAKKERRLVHHILLWGALDDQSCWGSGRTLRETALESTPILALLNESFVSSWSLVADLKVRHLLNLNLRWQINFAVWEL